MNIANLQLEGLYLAIASTHRLLVEKGLVSRDDLETALRQAEQTALGDYRTEDLSSAERDAIAFAPRLLIAANSGEATDFSELAKIVGQTKGKYGDEV